MRSRILTEERDLLLFKKGYELRGSSVDLPYLKKAQVRAFFDANDEMIAGYAFNMQRPLRYEKWIPEEDHSLVPVLGSNLRLGEMTVNWINKKPEPFFSERVYIRAFIDAVLSGAQFVVVGTLVSKVYGIHIQCLPRLLYIGETTYFGRSQRCWIYGASRSAMLAKLLTAPALEFVGKLLGLLTCHDKARRIAAAEGREHGNLFPERSSPRTEEQMGSAAGDVRNPATPAG